MQELADNLGISRTTISLVLKGKGDQYRISRQTQQKILQLVKKENYRPNYFAQALNRNRTQTIGIIFPDLFEAFMVEMVRGIEDVLAPRDYTMLVMTSRFRLDNEKKNLESLLHRGTDGILLVPTCHYSGEREDRNHLKHLNEGKENIIMLDRVPDFWSGPSIVQNDYAGGRYAGEYLQKSGCTSYLTVSLDLTASSIKNRLEGFSRTLPAAEIILLKEQNHGSSDLTEAIDDLLLRTSPSEQAPLGIFVTTTGLSLRVNEILYTRGLTLNKEYRIIRFGSDPKGFSSGMASIPQPHYEIGRQGATLLLEILEKKKVVEAARIVLDIPRMNNKGE